MTRIFNSDRRDRCRADHPDPFPVDTLTRIDRPTTLIRDREVPRVDERDGGFHKAALGHYGPQLQKEYKRFVPKYPLSGALVSMAGTLGPLVDVSGPAAADSATPWGECRRGYPCLRWPTRELRSPMIKVSCRGMSRRWHIS